jgi:hypothetical protein
MDSENKRRHERKEYNSNVILWLDNKSYVVNAENISLSGALISKKGIPKIELEDEIIITIPFKKQGKTVELKGRVARFVGDGAGVEFF